MAHDYSVTGYVSNDPKRIQTKDGRDLAVFSIAENKRFYDKQAQQWTDAKPTYYDVAVERESLRENVLAGLQKGQRVNVEGKYSPRAYVDRDGVAQVGHQVWAEDVSASMMHETQHRGEPAVERGSPQVGGPKQEATADVNGAGGWETHQPGPASQQGSAEFSGGSPQWGVSPPPMPTQSPMDYGPGLNR